MRFKINEMVRIKKSAMDQISGSPDSGVIVGINDDGVIKVQYLDWIGSFGSSDLRKDNGGLDPFKPPKIATEVACLHCSGIFQSKEMKYEYRWGSVLWWCPDPQCDGAGYKFDLFPTGEPFGRGIKEDALKGELS